MLGSREIENQIRRYTLSFPRILDPRAENGQFPVFLYTFDRLVEGAKKIPSQDEFVTAYIQDNAIELKRMGVLRSPSFRKGLEARARRTYPSFVRDLHFLALLREGGLHAHRDANTDIKSGVDLVVEYKGHTFYIHCYVGTKRGEYFRRTKDTRHHYEGDHVDLLIDRNSNKVRTIGAFWLYSKLNVDELKEKMDAILDSGS